MSILAAAPSLLELPFSDWAWEADIVVGAASALLLYGWAMSRARGRWRLRRAPAFAAGVAVVLVALQSGIAAYDDKLLSAHMVQHILLLMVAPPLLLASQPLLLAFKALPRRDARALALAVRRCRRLTHPGICLAAFTAVVLGTHVPGFYDATLHHPLLHDLEHASYLAAGVLLWWPLLGGDPVSRRQLGGLGLVLYMLAAMVPMDLLGAYLNRAPSVVYAPYVAPAHALGISAVVDQQRAGAIMWVFDSCLMAAGGIGAAMAAMAREERRQRRLDAASGAGPATGLAAGPRSASVTALTGTPPGRGR